MINRLLETFRSTLRRPYLLKVITNTVWLCADKIVRGGVGLFVAIWMARYLGPDQFGIWSFALAFTMIFGGLASLGLDSVVVRDVVKFPEKRDEILGTAFCLKLIAAFVVLPIVMFVIREIRPDDLLTRWLILFLAIGFVFQSVSAVDLFFQSQIKSKFSVYAMETSFLITALAKIVLIVVQAPLLAFGIAGFFESVLTAALLMAVYRYNRLFITKWRFRISIARSLLRDSWPLMLSSISIMIYMRIDQIMIGQMLGNAELGIFSAAVRVSEAWYFVPMAVTASVLPAIVEAKKRDETFYLERVQKLLDILSLLGLSVAVAVSIFGHFIVQALFGHVYEQAATILVIHCWGGIFVCVGVASSTWLTVENLQRFSFYRTLLGCLLNVVLNLWFIPIWGSMGAAFVTVVSQSISSYSIICFKDGRVIGRMMVQALTPWRRSTTLAREGTSV